MMRSTELRVALPGDRAAALRYVGEILGRLVLSLAFVVREAALFSAVVGALWLGGRLHHALYGNDAWVVDLLAVRHPFGTCAALFAAMLLAHFLGLLPNDGGHASPAASGTAVEADPSALYRSALEAATRPEPDLSAARDRLALAHAAGSPEAAYALASWHAHGIVVDRDPFRSTTYLAEAARGGVPEALNDLAASQEAGAIGEADHGTAYHGYLRAALLGHPAAPASVVRCLETGTGTDRDPCAAAAWRHGRPVAANRTPTVGTWPWAVDRP